jgi:[ribosomal protein S5]-alanine N-acetyltransferase
VASPSALAAGAAVAAKADARSAWRAALPAIETWSAVLREVEASDARPLCIALGRPEVWQHLPIGPSTPSGFARFIRWVRRERLAGRYLCFAVVPRGHRAAAGLFQLWPIEPGCRTAEMGCALDPTLWGTGTFLDCATAVVDFAFGPLGVRRLECRSAVTNERGAAAMCKLGAVREGTLRDCFECPAGPVDHIMWSILAKEWRPDGARNRRRRA